MLALVAIFSFSLQAAQAAALQERSETSENPIRRIVTLLQNMQSEVEADAKRDEEMNANFACYCKKNDGELSESTASLRAQIPEIEADIEASVSLKAQLDQELVDHKEDRKKAQATIESATAQREKEAKEFAATSGELKANIASCTGAVDALSKGMSGAFLQSDEANSLRKLVLQRSFDRYSEGVLTEFLSTSSQYAPVSGEVIGILSQLNDDMKKELADATKAENTAIAQFEGLVSAKEKEIAAAGAAIEDKTERAGNTAVKIVNLKNDLEDVKDSLGADERFLMELKENCKSKGGEFEERKAARAEELIAISETIKVLNDDDALDLFKKTLASPSLLQVSTRARDIRERALSALQATHGSQPQLNFIALALKGKKQGFEKVIKMIDGMVTTLEQEQKDDDTHRDWCGQEFDSADDKEKATQRRIDSLEAQISENEEGIATLTSELETLNTGIKDLDAAVAEATSARKEENKDFVQTQAQNNAALQLLQIAKNRLNKLYNPKLYVPPPTRELTEEERLYVASGGVLETPAPAGGIAGTGVQVPVFTQVKAGDAPPPPPETAEAYSKKDSSGPIALIDRLARDLEKDMQQAANDEKSSQKDYEKLMSDSALKRSADSKSITEKEGQKADLEADLMGAKDSSKQRKADLLATRQYIAQLHGSCDFLLQNYNLRKDARASEVDSLKKAKAVLSGADYSLVQTRKYEFLRKA